MALRRVEEGRLEDVNLAASQAENWGKSISDRRSNRSVPVLQLRELQLRSRGSLCGTMLALQHRAGLVSLHLQVVLRGMELALTPFGPLCGRSGVGAEMANENHGSPREEASLLSHSPGTSNQSQPCSPKPIRLVQDLPGTGKGQWQGGGVGRVPREQP